jgi:hypothetical protein
MFTVENIFLVMLVLIGLGCTVARHSFIVWACAINCIPAMMYAQFMGGSF